MDGTELGRRLRARRTATGRPLASVAVDAGLSVPLLANLENGRGNPTFAGMVSLARALGGRLDVSVREPGEVAPARPERSDGRDPPARVPAFVGGARFAAEAVRLARAAGVDPDTMGDRLIAAFAAVAAITGRDLDDLDCHRILDAIILAGRDTSLVAD